MNTATTPATRADQVAAIRAVATMILETVQEMGEQGAPSGPMYAALMGKMSLNQYESIMYSLVKAGRLRKEGHVYYFIKGL